MSDGIGISEIGNKDRYRGRVWTCPLCVEGVVPYGEIVCEGPAQCGHTANSTGQIYLFEDGRWVKDLTKEKT